MSKLERLTVQGIRSFSPKERNTVEFFTPLTLIVGSNGTGKTTIIECLKYATTGDLPPNSRGGAFVFDPKIAKEIDVKGEVRLIFRNNRNEVLSCVRSLQSTTRKSRAEQKTLECSLSRESGGNEILITSKPADVDRDIPEHLGVSRAILEDVIFCHQDESTWPTGDPSAMKKKLDDIFSSTKYNKALLGMKAAKKEIGSELKLKTQELSFFLKEKLKRDELVKRLAAYEDDNTRKKERVKAYSEEITRADATLKRLGEEVKVQERLEASIRTLKAEIDNCATFIKNFPHEVVKVLNHQEVAEKMKRNEEELKRLSGSAIEQEFVRVVKFRAAVEAEVKENEEKMSKINSKKGGMSMLEAERKRLEEETASAPDLTPAVTAIQEQTAEINKLRERLIILRNDQKMSEISKREKIELIKKYEQLQRRDEIEIEEVSIDYDKRDELEADIEELIEEIGEKQELVMKSGRRGFLLEEITRLQGEVRLKGEVEREIERIDYGHVGNEVRGLFVQMGVGIHEALELDKAKGILVPEKEVAEPETNLTDKLESSKYADAVYRNLLDLATKHKSCPLCKREMDRARTCEVQERIEGFLQRLEEHKTAMENKLVHYKRRAEENEGIRARNSIRERIKALVGDRDLGAVLETYTDKNTYVGAERQLERLRGRLAIIGREEEQLAKLEEDVRQVGDCTEDSASQDLARTKADLEKKRAELNEFNREIKRKEEQNREIEEEKENRRNIAYRDRCIEELGRVNGEDPEPLERELRAKEEAVAVIKRDYERKKLEMRMKTARIKDIVEMLPLLSAEIKALEASTSKKFECEGVNFMGREIPASDLKNAAEYEKIRNEVLAHKNSIIRVNLEIEADRKRLRVIEENIRLNKAKERVVTIEAEMNALGEPKLREIQAKYKNEVDRRIKLGNSESVIKGELKQIQQALRSHKEELETYKESGKKYLRCALEIKVLELSQDDLDKCVNGLDKAIVDFHRTKIEEVNRTLRDLWANTYKGNDIDWIELKAESSESRAYNYRMVMVKGGVELDMRGRSSAGQKMIASILFRIALADSFSCGCNVLALDEPTTNLDRANIESLAQTLLLIIKEREDFQLIVITHDEEFVEILNREGCESFYRLKRDRNGMGRIERCSGGALS